MASGQRRLVWHIGHHKTGSTSLQYTLAAGGVEVNGSTPLYTSPQHNYLLPEFRQWDAEQGVRPGNKTQPGLAVTAKILAESDFDLAVFSAEHLEEANPKLLRRVLEEFFLPHVSQLQVVAYVRPHAARLRSSYAERVKIGDFDGSITEFYAGFRDHLMYEKRLAPWREVFQDALTVRPMVRKLLHSESVVHDFMHTVLGTELPYTVNSEHSVNESLSIEQLAFIQEFRQYAGHMDTRMRRRAGVALGQLMNGQMLRENTPLALHRELAEEVRDYYLADARAMDATYFGGSSILESELNREVGEAVAEPQSMNPDKLLSTEVREIIRVTGTMYRAVAVHAKVPPARIFNRITKMTRARHQ